MLGKRRRIQGFTLIETLVVILMLGVMGAIAGPSLLGFLAKAKVNQAFSELYSSIQITQRSAMRVSNTCTLFLPENNISNGQVTATCALIDSAPFEDVTVKYNRANSKKINFNHRGHTNSTRTIVLYSSDTSYKRCIVISNGIGMVRRGRYTENNLDSISATHCETSNI